MFDHLGIVVADLEVSRRFYLECLAALDVRLLEDHSEPGGTGWLIFGCGDDEPFFVVARRQQRRSRLRAVSGRSRRSC